MGLGGTPVGLGSVGRPYLRSGRVGRPSLWAVWGREAFPEVCEGSGGSRGRPGGIGWPWWMSRRGQEALARAERG